MRREVVPMFTPEQPHQEQGDVKTGLQGLSFEPGPPLAGP